LQRLKGLIDRGLEATAALGPAIVLAFGWVHRAAGILDAEGVGGRAVRQRLGGLLGVMARHRTRAGALAGAVGHFVKVSRSYWPGLFACYDTPELPRTNNDLEQAFGSHRYHERRATGRQGASPGWVPRGAARLVAGPATRAGAGTAADLAAADGERWQQRRAEMEQRRQRRVERRRFRRDPDEYLKGLENKLNQSRLPS
jgi:hypothetical protein